MLLNDLKLKMEERRAKSRIEDRLLIKNIGQLKCDDQKAGHFHLLPYNNKLR